MFQKISTFSCFFSAGFLSTLFFPRKADAKIRPFFKLPNIFFRFSCIFFPNHPIVNSFQNKLFFMRLILRLAKRLFPLVFTWILTIIGTFRLLITMYIVSILHINKNHPILKSVFNTILIRYCTEFYTDFIRSASLWERSRAGKERINTVSITTQILPKSIESAFYLLLITQAATSRKPPWTVRGKSLLFQYFYVYLQPLSP